ncbi:MAG: hypothetical protein S4CHLAM2_02320 [Chlamydiales bacterium]|nr:hypothetical protein [Chlamydiales bacterium]
MIFGPHSTQQINRLQPVDGDHSEDQQDERKRRRVLYQGRAWAEKEEELPFQPEGNQVPTPKKQHSPRVYADRAVLDRAQALLCQMTTLEEKVAQLCFLETEAVYNAALQHEVEFLIQTWQVGGVLFKNGNYKRQAYLIECFQNVSKTALLIANDFLHGLSFYLQGDQLPSEEELPEQRFSDLGKAVMAQNRRLGVHIQFDQERVLAKLRMNPKQAQAFRRGIREGQGIVAKEGVEPVVKTVARSHSAKKGGFPILAFNHLQVQETIGFKTLTFFDATGVRKRFEETLLAAFEAHYDVFLLKGNVSETIRALCRLVRTGKIREEDLDRHIMKALIIKALYFK